LNELWYDSILISRLCQGTLINIYAALAVSWFSELRKSARNLTNTFGSASTRKQVFSGMKQNKLMFRSRVTDAHLHDVMRNVI